MSMAAFPTATSRRWIAAAASVAVAVSVCFGAAVLHAAHQEQVAFRAAEWREVNRCVAVVRDRMDDPTELALRAYLADPSHAEFCRDEPRVVDECRTLLLVRGRQRAADLRMDLAGWWLPTPIPESLSESDVRRIKEEHSSLVQKAVARVRVYDPEVGRKSWCGTCNEEDLYREVNAEMVRIYEEAKQR